MKLLQVKSMIRATMIMARMREIIFWGSFLGLIALVAVAFWVSANITKPIEELTTMAQKIRSGELPENTTIKSPDEVGELADALNEIVENLRRARSRLDDLETMRRDFFGNINLKLERPLQEIRDNLEYLRRSEASKDPELMKHLDQARDQSRNLRKILHTLIEISELEFGEVSLEMKAVPLQRIAEKIVARHKERAQQKGLNFEFQIPDKLASASVQGDFRLLRIALDHLVSNAIDYTKTGQVRIVCLDQGELVKIVVEDTGEGIPADQLERIFERFYQVEPSRGTAGLGLAIVKHIFDAHGQKIDVESVLGVGSKFTFWLHKSPLS